MTIQSYVEERTRAWISWDRVLNTLRTLYSADLLSRSMEDIILTDIQHMHDCLVEAQFQEQMGDFQESSNLYYSAQCIGDDVEMFMAQIIGGDV